MSTHPRKRALAPSATPESLRKEAKHWHKALRRADPAARDRLLRVLPKAGATITLREVQHALALEHGVDGWVALKELLADGELARRSAAERANDTRAVVVPRDQHDDVSGRTRDSEPGPRTKGIRRLRKPRAGDRRGRPHPRL